jgi:glycogen debranching enzyme
VVRHGLIPNLFDEGNNPRYNARDACWFFLNAIRHFIEATHDSSILEDEVMLKYPDRAFSNNWKQPESNMVRLVDIVVGILMSHLYGIDFVEDNAGPGIDEHMTKEGFHVSVHVGESGLVMGGNEWNCGTWMDKMGSVQGRNKGVAATSRHGANIEINGIALAVLEFFGNNSVVGRDYGKGSEFAFLRDWTSKLAHSFDNSFWNETNRIYNDTICGDIKGGKLRPNGLVGLSQVPIHAVDKMHASQYIQVCEESLLGPLGMRTLSATDPDYNGWYDNSDSSGGFNYHNGPEWVWLVGHFLMAAWRFDVLTSREQISVIVARHFEYLEHESVGWRSLPELTNTNGAFCMHSCPSQAWSVCCLLEALDTIGENS